MTRTLGRFFGPYFTFAMLSGAGAGFVFGAVVTIIALIAAIVTFIGGILGGATWEAVREISKAFFPFAQFVLIVVAHGFVAGFFAGLTSALIGGFAGFCWSFAVALGAGWCVLPAYLARGPHGVDFTLAFVLIFGTCGVMLPLLLQTGAIKSRWAQIVREFLGRSWLVQPPQSARIAGIALPILLYGVWEICIVWPEYVTHPNYAARLGRWTTWQSSKRLVMSTGFARSSSCQSNLKQIGLGMKQYLSDYDDFYPPIPTNAQDGTSAVIQPYLKSTRIFQCPSEFYGPETPDFASGDFNDYWFNARFYDLNDATISSPSSRILWGDGNTGAGESNAAYSLRNLPPNFAPSMRHRKGANYAFVDDHVKWLLPRAVSNASTAGNFAPTLSTK